MKRLDITAKKILENFQQACVNQTGKRMEFGSEAYTLSSILSAALENFMGVLNKSYRNMFTKTAEGKYLDNLAARYGLSRRTEQWTKPFFGCQFKCSQASLAHEYDVGEISMTFGGHRYTNSTRVAYEPISGLMSCMMRADERHNDYLQVGDIIAQATRCNFNGASAPIQIMNIAGKGLQQCSLTLNNDDDFREYINASKYLHQSAVRYAFEEVAVNYADFIIDAKCATQNEWLYYHPGYVDLYIKPDTTAYSIFNAIGTDALTDELKTVMSGNPLNTLCIGQTLRVHLARRYRLNPHFIGVKASPKLKDHIFSLSNGVNLTVDELCRIKVDALIHYYNQRRLGVCQSFFWNAFQQDLVNPLSALSDRPYVFGTVVPDVLWNEALKDFAFEGIIHGSQLQAEPPLPNSYIHLDPSSIIVDEIQY